MYLVWNKSLETGNEMIDTQHRLLVMLCMKLDLAIGARKSPQDLARIVMELERFAEFHFVSEENLMAEIGYGDLERHRGMHADLLAELREMNTHLLHHKATAQDLLLFVERWLIQHIAREDTRIGKHALKSAQRPIGEELYHQYFRLGPVDAG